MLHVIKTWPSEEEEINKCIWNGIFNFSSATPPVWTSATQTAREQEELCSVCSSGVRNRQEMKSISCNAKNAAKLKDPSDTTVKENLFFPVVNQCPAAGERCAPSKAEMGRKSNENLRGSTFPLRLFLTSTRTHQHLRAKLSWSQRSSQRAPSNFSHLLTPFSGHQSFIHSHWFCFP